MFEIILDIESWKNNFSSPKNKPDCITSFGRYRLKSTMSGSNSFPNRLKYQAPNAGSEISTFNTSTSFESMDNFFDKYFSKYEPKKLS